MRLQQKREPWTVDGDVPTEKEQSYQWNDRLDCNDLVLCTWAEADAKFGAAFASVQGVGYIAGSH